MHETRDVQDHKSLADSCRPLRHFWLGQPGPGAAAKPITVDFQHSLDDLVGLTDAASVRSPRDGWRHKQASKAAGGIVQRLVFEKINRTLKNDLEFLHLMGMLLLDSASMSYLFKQSKEFLPQVAFRTAVLIGAKVMFLLEAEDEPNAVLLSLCISHYRSKPLLAAEVECLEHLVAGVPRVVHSAVSNWQADDNLPFTEEPFLCDSTCWLERPAGGKKTKLYWPVPDEYVFNYKDQLTSLGSLV